MTTAADAIREAMEALGGEADARDVKTWVEARYPSRWVDVTVDMADLTLPGNAASTYLPTGSAVPGTCESGSIPPAPLS